MNGNKSHEYSAILDEKATNPNNKKTEFHITYIFTRNDIPLSLFKKNLFNNKIIIKNAPLITRYLIELGSCPYIAD